MAKLDWNKAGLNSLDPARVQSVDKEFHQAIKAPKKAKKRNAPAKTNAESLRVQDINSRYSSAALEAWQGSYTIRKS